ncbi:MAG: glycerophosphodiester phosphodiesterase family protein, partial [Butyricicoccus pullicaecorum]|nr:glycerophosphodiester phosphodiesterase family protein [Butyricicoccus pullicaecorum]
TGIEGVEIDIRMTCDGVIVIHHDATLERMSQGSNMPCSKPIEQCVWKELETLDISYANHLLGDAADTRTAKLMRLSDLFDWVHDLTRRIILEIEYKASGMMPELCRLLQAFDKRNDCVIFASDPALIAEIQQYVNTYGVPEGVKLGANIGRLTPEWKERIPQMQLFEIGLDIDALEREDIAWLRARNLMVFANLGDTPEGWKKICTRGLTGFKTDDTAAFTAWWENWKSNSM